MGYRSAITAVFYTNEKDEWPLLKLFVEENFPKDLADCLEQECEEPCKRRGFVFRVDDYKWYDSYPEVQAFNEFEERFTSMEKCVDGTWACEFARIGEETDDIEERNSNHADYILRVVRHIEIEF
jgi:hypothetical protein